VGDVKAIQTTDRSWSSPNLRQFGPSHQDDRLAAGKKPRWLKKIRKVKQRKTTRGGPFGEERGGELKGGSKGGRRQPGELTDRVLPCEARDA